MESKQVTRAALPQPSGSVEIAAHRDEICGRIQTLVGREYAYHAEGIMRDGSAYCIAGVRQINPAFRSFQLDRLEHALRSMLGRPRQHQLLHIFGKTLRIFAWMLKTAEPEQRPSLVARYRDVLRLLLRTRNMTWGLSNAMAGLMALQELGENDGTDYIAQVFSPTDQRFMRLDLHWNKHFDRRSGKLIGLPNNYYPVMAWVALGRSRLGWDDTTMLELFIGRSFEGFVDPSGNGWFDDSGVGTYDVYHTVATYELIDLIQAYDPEKAIALKPYCENLAEEYLYMGQKDGAGFPFGRTIGVNGDMWMASGLLMSMTLGYGDAARYEHAYQLATAAIDKAMTFWYDGERHISNKWFDGRRTDPYMTESRILDATLDLYLRLMQAHDMLRALDPASWTRPQLSAPLGGRLFRHSEEAEVQKATFVYRTSERSYTFPMVVYGRPNGQILHYTNYLPNVRSSGVLESPIYVEQPFLNPRIACSDGKMLLPYAHYQDIQNGDCSGGCYLTWHQEEFSLPGDDGGRFHDISYRCLWFLQGDVLARVDLWSPRKDIDIDTYEIELVSMGKISTGKDGRYLVEYDGTRFYYSPVGGNLSLSTECSMVEADPDYRTYAGQGLCKARSASGQARLLSGEVYYAGFAIDFDSVDATQQPKPNRWSHRTTVCDHAVRIDLTRSSEGRFSISVD
jgi:hypothetical protein